MTMEISIVDYAFIFSSNQIKLHNLHSSDLNSIRVISSGQMEQGRHIVAMRTKLIDPSSDIVSDLILFLSETIKEYMMTILQLKSMA